MTFNSITDEDKRWFLGCVEESITIALVKKKNCYSDGNHNPPLSKFILSFVLFRIAVQSIAEYHAHTCTHINTPINI